MGRAPSGPHPTPPPWRRGQQPPLCQLLRLASTSAERTLSPGQAVEIYLRAAYSSQRRPRNRHCPRANGRGYALQGGTLSFPSSRPRSTTDSQAVSHCQRPARGGGLKAPGRTAGQRRRALGAVRAARRPAPLARTRRLLRHRERGLRDRLPLIRRIQHGLALTRVHLMAGLSAAFRQKIVPYFAVSFTRTTQPVARGSAIRASRSFAMYAPTCLTLFAIVAINTFPF